MHNILILQKCNCTNPVDPVLMIRVLAEEENSFKKNLGGTQVLYS